jgi:hypothetical protein
MDAKELAVCQEYSTGIFYCHDGIKFGVQPMLSFSKKVVTE